MRVLLCLPSVPRRGPARAAVHFLRRRRVVAVGLGSTLGLPSHAQAPWPQRPLRMVIGFPPGGGVDLIARLLAPHFAARLGQTLVVENRPGANGNIAMDAVARSADSHTLFFGNIGNLAINNELYPGLGFDTLRDFAPVGQVLENAFFLAVHRRLPIATLGQFIDYARAHPGRLSFGSSGIGSAHQLAFELFRRPLDLDITHVPYRGMAPAIQDFAAGSLDAFFDGLVGVRPMVDAGFARILATTAARRLDAQPDIPTIAEGANLPDFAMMPWMALVVPSATPPEIRLRLERDLAEILARDDVARNFAAHGFTARFRGGDDTRALITAERARWGRVIREASITPRD